MNLFRYCNAQGQSCVAMTQNGCKGERVLWCDSPVLWCDIIKSDV